MGRWRISWRRRAGLYAWRRLDAMAKHSLDFWMTSEDLPDPNNRVLVGKDGTITLAYTKTIWTPIAA